MGHVGNPTGKGGFGERPQDINRRGHWKPNESYTYQLNRYLRFTAEQLDEERQRTDLTVAQGLALAAITDAFNLRGAARVSAIEKLISRVEGQPTQQVEQSVSVAAAPPQITVEFPDAKQIEQEEK